jgi:16S rRNA G1207 methylase RsmC
VQHYFSNQKGEELQKKLIEVELAGQTYQLYSSSNVFSAHGVDKGTKVLLEYLFSARSTLDLSNSKTDQQKTILDLGCGWGTIALTLGLKCPNAQIDAVDVNAHAAQLTNLNAEKLALSHVQAFVVDSECDSGESADHADAVQGDNTRLRIKPAMTSEEPAIANREPAITAEKYDLIVSNPPIRIGKEALHQMLIHWLKHLKPHGKAVLVVQKNLGSDSLVDWINSSEDFLAQKLASSKGFRIVSVERT